MKRLAMITSGIAAIAAASCAGAADAQRGKQIFEQCAACHSLEAGAHGVGPSLKGLFGRKVAALEDYRYSPAMKRSTITWTRESLAAFLADPQKEIKGNRMPFSGLPEAAERDDVVAYLLQAAR